MYIIGFPRILYIYINIYVYIYILIGFPRLFLLLNDCKERPIEYRPKEGASDDMFSVDQVMAWIQIHLHQGCIDFEQEVLSLPALLVQKYKY